jgi:predicted transcriptional regulator
MSVRIGSSLKSSKEEFSILQVIGDVYFTTILEAIHEIPKSAIEIYDDTKIPLSTVYRRIQHLHDLGFLQISGTISSEGKRVFLYKSKVKSLEVKFDGKLNVKIELK